MSRIALGRTFAKFNVNGDDNNYYFKGPILIPLDSIVTISTCSSKDNTSIIFFKSSSKKIENVIVEGSVDDIEKYLRSIE